MGEIVELDSRRQHVVADFRCGACAHEFISVHMAHTKVKVFECPKCHRIAASYKHPHEFPLA